MPDDKPEAERQPTVFAVIPAHNRVVQTLRCLDSLSSSTIPVRPVVVDDGSTDGTAAAVADRHPGAVVLRGDGNLWWAGATNLGVDYALANGADYVLALNNDGVVVPSTVGILLDAERALGPGLYCSQRHDLDYPDQVFEPGNVLDWSTREGFRRIPGGGSQAVRVDVSGANSLLVPRRCFEEVGLFDADCLPQNLADWDFELRAQAKGWPMYSVPGSIVYEDLSTLGPRASLRMSVGQAFRLVTSRRSPYFPVYQWRFFGRHAPRGRRPIILFWRYGLVARSVVWHYLGYRSGHIGARTRGGKRREGAARPS